MKKLKTLNNIPEEVLDTLRDKYSDAPYFRVNDDRDRVAFNRRRGYFLISKDHSKGESTIEFTFIWIDNNIWQIRFLNTGCSENGVEFDPLATINELLNL